MRKTISLKILPTETQQQTINAIISNSRFVYNSVLSFMTVCPYATSENKAETIFKSDTDALSYYNKMLRDYDFLKNSEQAALKTATLRASRTAKRLYEIYGTEDIDIHKYLERKKSMYQSYTTPNVKIPETGNYITLCKIGDIEVRGKGIEKVRNAEPFYVKITKRGSMGYYLSIVYEEMTETDLHENDCTDPERIVSIRPEYADKKSFISTSDGTTYELPNTILRKEAAISRKKKALSRQTKGSESWKQTLKQIKSLQNAVTQQYIQYVRNLAAAITGESQAVMYSYAMIIDTDMDCRRHAYFKGTTSADRKMYAFEELYRRINRIQRNRGIRASIAEMLYGAKGRYGSHADLKTVAKNKAAALYLNTKESCKFREAVANLEEMYV